MPNAVLEAFVYGTPVVATAVGGVPDMIDADSGWLVPEGDPAALAEALHAVLIDRSEGERRALGARERVRASFTVERQADAWKSAAEAALQSRDVRGPEVVGAR